MAHATQTSQPEGSMKFEATLTMGVTDLAKEKLTQFLNGKSLDMVGVRVQVQAGGCSGASYGMEFADKPLEGEMEMRANGVRLFVHPMYAPMLNGITIDYVDELMGGGFKIDNPNSKGGCGCGKSFSC